MARTKDEAVSGRLDLIDYFHETASTHADTTRRAALLPHGQTGVLLETYYDHNNVYEATSPASTRRWVIGRDELIELIQKHGKPVS